MHYAKRTSKCPIVRFPGRQFYIGFNNNNNINPPRKWPLSAQRPQRWRRTERLPEAGGGYCCCAAGSVLPWHAARVGGTPSDTLHQAPPSHSFDISPIMRIDRPDTNDMQNVKPNVNTLIPGSFKRIDV